MKTQQFKVEGMSCSSCARIIERSLKKLDGVLKVNITLGKLSITYDSTKINDSDIINAINYAGFTAAVEEE